MWIFPLYFRLKSATGLQKKELIEIVLTVIQTTKSVSCPVSQRFFLVSSRLVSVVDFPEIGVKSGDMRPKSGDMRPNSRF